MGKAMKKKPRPVRVPCPSGEDATPQRLAHGDHELANGIIDRAGERTPLVRKFKTSHLDRWHKAQMIDARQWNAGEVYRMTHERCQFRLSVIASYGERIGAPVNPGDFGYGLPMLDVQAEARSRMRLMREVMPIELRGMIDRFLLHDSMPRYGGKKHHEMVTSVRKCLTVLAEYLRI